MQLSRLGIVLRSKINLYSSRIKVIELNKMFTNTFNKPAIFNLNQSLLQIKNIYVTNLKENYSTEIPKTKIKFSMKNLNQKADKSMKNAVWYILSGFVLMVGISYAAVPLFKMFCESQGIDANTDFRDLGIEALKTKLKTMKKIENRNICVKFVASTSSDLLWTFDPCQSEIIVSPGETALAFFRAKNLTNRSIVGVATYSILPYEAGLYFNKIQCFCFEEQRLDPNEEIDMPVFFYIDEQYSEDPKLEEVDEICLSYTFFESKGSDNVMNLPKLATPFPSL